MNPTKCIECERELPHGAKAVACPHCGSLYCDDCCKVNHCVGEVVTCLHCGEQFTMSECSPYCSLTM